MHGMTFFFDNTIFIFRELIYFILIFYNFNVIFPINKFLKNIVLSSIDFDKKENFIFIHKFHA